MPRQSAVYEVLIASPSDVVEQRLVLTEVVEDWNSANSRSHGVSLQPLRWELDGVPASGAPPQEILNKQLVEDADVLMAVFWTRLGTPTGNAISGTVEEIEHFRSKGKPVLLYFCEEAVPHGHDPEQFRLLNEYRKSLRDHTFYSTFKDPEELRRHANRDLARTVNDLTAGPAARRLSSFSARKSELARVLLQPQHSGVIPGSTVKVVKVYGAIENLSASKRIREYSCTLSIPTCCLTYADSRYSAEIPSSDPSYRRFRYTEREHSLVPIQQGDRFQIISIEIAVGHLSAEDQEKCLKMDVIADGVADGDVLQARTNVSQLMGISRP